MAERDLRLLAPRPVRELPADLVAVVALVVVADLAALLPVVSETPLRVIFGLPVVLFLPGYVFVAALFPEAGEAPEEAEAAAVSGRDAGTTGERRGIDGVERVALSFGTSIAISPLIGLALNFTPWGIRLVPILASLSAFTLLAVAVAAVRRWGIPEEERFRVPYRAWLAAGWSELRSPPTRLDAALNVLVVASLLLAVGSVAYAVTVPRQGEAFTEFYLLTRGEDGELVAADYPTEFVRGEAKPVVVGIGNHEHETVAYEVVVLLQDVEFVGNNSTRVVDERELGRFGATVADDRLRDQADDHGRAAPAGVPAVS